MTGGGCSDTLYPEIEVKGFVEAQLINGHLVEHNKVLRVWKPSRQLCEDLGEESQIINSGRTEKSLAPVLFAAFRFPAVRAGILKPT